MAFTELEKAAIKKRAQELLAADKTLAAGAAAKQAMMELATPEQVAALSAPAPVVKKEKDSTVIKAQIDAEERDFVNNRMADLEESGRSREEARSIATKEFEDTFKKPLPAGFGGIEEREKATGVTPDAASPINLLEAAREPRFADALRPQTFLPQSETKVGGNKQTEADRLLEPSIGAGAGMQPDLANLAESFRDMGMDERSVGSSLTAFKQMYQRNLVTAQTKGLKGQDAVSDAYGASIKEIQGIPAALSDKSTYIKDTVSQGPADPWFRAFSNQISQGEGIPNLTEGQRNFLNAQSQIEIEKKAAELKAAKPNEDIVTLSNGTEMPAAAWDLIKGNPENAGLSIKSTKSVAIPDERFKAEAEKAIDVPWWLDAEKSKKFQTNPESLSDKGILSDTSPLGTIRETDAGWLIRSAMAPLNAFAGLVSDITLRGGDLPEIRQKERERKTPVYKDSPVLLNIAEGRGFVMEFKEAADLLNIEGIPYYITVGGAFAADLLDPSLDLAKAAGVVAKTGIQSAKLRNAVKLSNLPETVKASLMAGADDFVDSWAVSKLANDRLGSKRFSPGDVRNIVISDLSRSMEASQFASKQIKAGVAPDEIAAMLKESGLNKTTWGKRFISEGSDADAWRRLGRIPDSVRTKNIARSLGILAKGDDEVQVIFRAVDDAVKGQKITTPKVSLYMQALKKELPNKFDILKKVINYDEAANAVYKASKDMKAFDNIVTLTKNTFISKGDVQTVLKKVGETEIGTLAKKLSKGDIEFKITRDSANNPIVSAAYKLDADDAAQLSRAVDELKSFRKIDDASAKTIISNIEKGFISTENFRAVLDANIDLVAEGMAVSGGAKIARGRDVARLGADTQIDLLVPLEARSFSRSVLNQWWNKVKGTKPSNLSIGQKRLLKESQQSISGLDVKLRNSIGDMMNNPDMRMAYTGSTEPITRQEALTYLIVGPKGQRATKDIEELLDFGLNQTIFTKESKENIFDFVTGTKGIRRNLFLTDEGVEAVEALIQVRAAEVAAEPSKLWAAQKEIVEEAQKHIRPGEDIQISLVDGKVTPENQIGMFFKMESDKIKTDVLKQLIGSEIGKGNFKFVDAFTDEFMTTVSDALESVGINVPADDLATAMIANRIKYKMLSHPTYINVKPNVDDLAYAISDELGMNYSSALATLEKMYKNNPGIEDAFGSLFNHASDVASGIMRRNAMDRNIDAMAVYKELKRMMSGDEFSQLKAIYGGDIASQLKSQFDKGSNDLIKALEAASDERLYGKGFVSYALDGIENSRYFALLNLRPRFHGANLATGADIFYNTTGRIPNPSDMFEGISVIRGKNPNKIIHTDSAGRSYTQGEIRDILTETGGRSVYGMQNPSAMGASLIRSIDDATGAKIKAGRALDVFSELPQNEDLLYRYAALKMALNDGRSMDDAIALARKSMFDIGDITGKEKAVRRFFLFYGFARNNLVNFMKNLIDGPRGWKRIAATAKTKRGLDAMFTEEEEIKFSPSYAQTRAFFGTRPLPDSDKKVLITSPSIATLDAANTFAELLKIFPFAWGPEVIGSMLGPDVKGILGVEDSFNRATDKVPPEHVILLSALAEMSGANVTDVISFLAGSEVIPKAGPSDKGAVGGNIYYLTPDQASRWNTIIDTMRYTGINSPVIDWTRSISPSGTPGEGRSIGEALAFAAGFVTPMKVISPEEQAYYDSLDRMKAAKAYNSKSKRIADIAIQEGMTEEEKAMPVPGDRKEQIKIKKSSVPKSKRSMMEVKRDMDNLLRRMKSGEFRGASGKAAAIAERDALIKEVKEIKVYEQERKRQQGN